MASIAQYAKLVTKPANDFFAGDSDNNIYFLVSGTAHLALEKEGQDGKAKRPRTAAGFSASRQMPWAEGWLAGVNVSFLVKSFAALGHICDSNSCW